jgi:hypothetical protein
MLGVLLNDMLVKIAFLSPAKPTFMIRLIVGSPILVIGARNIVETDNSGDGHGRADDA